MTRLTDAVVLLDINFKPDRAIWREIARKSTSNAVSSTPASAPATKPETATLPSVEPRRDTK